MPLSRKPRVSVRDEGIDQGSVATIDFVGAGVTAAIANGIATVTIAGGAGSDISLSKHVIGTTFTVTAAYSAYIARYLEVSAGITLEIGSDGDLEIG